MVLFSFPKKWVDKKQDSCVIKGMPGEGGGRTHFTRRNHINVQITEAALRRKKADLTSFLSYPLHPLPASPKTLLQTVKKRKPDRSLPLKDLVLERGGAN